MYRLSTLPPVGRAILTMVVAVAMFSTMNVLVKWLGSSYPVTQVIFFRASIALVVILPLVHRAGGLASLRTARPLGHLARCLIGVTSMACGFTAITYLPLANAAAFAFTAPLWTTLLGLLILGERVRWRRAVALVVGFAGVLIMLRPDANLLREAMAGGRVAVGSLLALTSAALAACAMISIRRLSATEPSTTIVFYFMLSGSIIMGLACLPDFVMPTPTDALLFVALGVVGGVGQLLLTSAYRGAPVAVIAPFDYTAMLWATGYGYLIWSEVPHPMVALGALIVIGSGVYIIWRESKLGMIHKAQAASTTKNL
ncbi:DMT family transporter [Niveispirillum fermenti]|uniref:DMT family transporter n=1 Tax=Niveispirillum fermenti TaxID=1233113 RepID=UPI003A8B026C